MKKEIEFKNIALVKEIESPENPGALEKRVALTPKGVGELIAFGINVFVEYGAGLGVGFSDDEYVSNGAILEENNKIYQNKDLIIKFKGPSLESIALMKKGCTLFCMAHFNSFPARAKMLEEQQINVIAMEEILESPKEQTDIAILARVGMKEALKSFIEDKSIENLKVYVLGRSEKLAGSIRRAGNRNPYSLQLLNENIKFEDLEEVGANTLYFYDSSEFKNLDNLVNKLKENNSNIFDIAVFEKEKGVESIIEYKKTHPASEFGLRRIQCLHITGMAGARYGLKLLRDNKPNLDIKDAKVVVLGYGNVARGAMHEMYNQGVEKIHILGRTHTTDEKIQDYLKDVDLVVNGAELPFALRGKVYLVSNEHLKTIVPNKSVIIDLVGGSATNRSAIEGSVECTYLTNPQFDLHGVTISSLWGWPMLGMMKESAVKYSSQIIDVLIKKEKIIEGLDTLPQGVKRALVCGPFKI